MSKKNTIEPKYKALLDEYEEMGAVYPSDTFDIETIKKMLLIESEDAKMLPFAIWENFLEESKDNWVLALAVLKSPYTPKGTGIYSRAIDNIPKEYLAGALRLHHLSETDFLKVECTIQPKNVLYYLMNERFGVSDEFKNMIANLPDHRQETYLYFGYEYMNPKDKNHMERIDEALKSPADEPEDKLIAIANNVKLDNERRYKAAQYASLKDLHNPTPEIANLIYESLASAYFELEENEENKKIISSAESELYIRIRNGKLTAANEMDFVERYVNNPKDPEHMCIKELIENSFNANAIIKIINQFPYLESDLYTSRRRVSNEIYEYLRDKQTEDKKRDLVYIKFVLGSHLSERNILNANAQATSRAKTAIFDATVISDKVLTSTIHQVAINGIANSDELDIQQKIMKELKCCLYDNRNIESKKLKDDIMVTLWKILREDDLRSNAFFGELYRQSMPRTVRKLHSLNKKEYEEVSREIEYVKKIFNKNIESIPKLKEQIELFEQEIKEASQRSQWLNSLPKYFKRRENFDHQTYFELDWDAFYKINENEIKEIIKTLKEASKDELLWFRDSVYGLLDNYCVEDMDKIQKLIYKLADLNQELEKEIKSKERCEEKHEEYR